jgi:hypothetical protein
MEYAIRLRIQKPGTDQAKRQLATRTGEGAPGA